MNITRKAIYVLSLLLATSFLSNAQIAINSDGSSPDSSAILDVTSTSKGVLIPRMTTSERTNISSPATGLLVYDTNFNTFWYYANSTWNNLSNAILTDIDGDTKIQVEESSDEDVIRFDLGGTEYFKFDKGQIDFLNTGGSIFIGEGTGVSDDYSDNENIFIGKSAGFSNTTGYENIFIGKSAGSSNTTGYQNAFTGSFCGIRNSTGRHNSFFGMASGFFNTTGRDNSFFGAGSGYFNHTGSYNVALGYSAGYSNFTGDYNVFLGYKAGWDETGSNKLYIANSSVDSNNALIYGEFDNSLLQINGKLNINGMFDFPTIDGDSLQTLVTDGDGTLTWSTLNGLVDTDGDTKIQVEENSDEDVIRFDLGGMEYFKFDEGRIEILNTGGSIFIGEEAGYSNTVGEDNVFIGERAGYFNTVGEDNVFIGEKAGYSNVYGGHNMFIGQKAGYSNGSGVYNMFIGEKAGYSNIEGASNIFIGQEAGYSNTYGGDNFFIGYRAGYSNIFGEKNMFIGQEAGYSSIIGEKNLFLGYRAGYSNIFGENNVFLGCQAGYNEMGSNKLYIDNSDTTKPLIYGDFDSDSLQINGKLSINGAFNFPTSDGDSLQTLVTDGNGTLTWSTLNDLVDSDADTKIQVEESSDDDIIRFDLGGTEFMRLDSGRIEIVNTGNSVFLGEEAGENDDLSDNNSTFIGYQAGFSNTSGINNTFLGTEAGYSSTTGYNNTFIGGNSGYSNDGELNVIIGHSSGKGNTTGKYNTILGSSAGFNSTGNSNIFIGYNAGYNEAGSNKLYIANSKDSSPLIYGDFSTDILEFNGSVGVGTTPTNALLEVFGSGNALVSYTYGYLNSSGNTSTWTNAPVYSIYADNKIGGLAFHAHSDERIKNIQGISNSKNDLNTLMNIEITNYTMKDSITNGNEVTKKVIAQQVKSVYSRAVSTNTTQAIPDIYQRATIQNGWVQLKTDLQVGDRVQLIFNDKKEIFDVLDTKENGFQVFTMHQGDIFVYGKEVDDFHTVDYEAISMLNVSATQQLAKEVEQLNLLVRQARLENETLKSQLQKVSNLEQENVEMKAMLEQIQAQLLSRQLSNNP